MVFSPKQYFPLFMTSCKRALMESADLEAFEAFFVAMASDGDPDPVDRACPLILQKGPPPPVVDEQTRNART